MGTTIFDTPIWTTMLVVIHSSKSKMAKVNGFAIMFDGIQLTQMANYFQI